MIALKKHQTTPIGLQLSPRYATLVQLAGKEGALEPLALAYGEIPYDEEMSSEEHDHETVSVLRKLVADHRFRGKSVVSCLGSDELFVQNVRLPQLPPEEVDKVVRWEAEERLPYPIDEAEIRHLKAGQVRQDSNVKQEVILLACHQGVVQRHLSVLEHAGLSPVAIDVEPCAVMRCLTAAYGKEWSQGRHACLNLGERATTVIFSEADQILFLKYISYGAHHLDAAVAKQMSIGLHDAAHMRATVTSAAELDSNDEIHRSVIDAVRNPLEAIATEVELCLRYYKVTFRGKPLDKIMVTGSDSSPWLADFLTRRLDTTCEMGNPLNALEHWPTFAGALERPGRWSTAMGLSLR